MSREGENQVLFQILIPRCYRTSVHAVPDVTALVPDVTRVKMLIKKDACNREKHAEEKQTMYLHHHMHLQLKLPVIQSYALMW